MYGGWEDKSKINENVPTIRLIAEYPEIQPVNLHCGNVVLKVDSNNKQINSRVVIGAINMKTKDEPYIISL